MYTHWKSEGERERERAFSLYTVLFGVILSTLP